MKNILLLTDFSENAKAAAETALTLSQKMHTNLLLLNTFVFYPVAENYVGGQWFPELYKEQEEENQERLYQLKLELEQLSLATLEPGDRRPVIATQVEDIGLHFGLADVLEKNRIELVVMGTHEDEAFGKNHVSNVIRNARLPVLVVPPGADLKKPTKAIYATDYDLQDIDAIAFLSKIAKSLHEEINVVHVAAPEEKKTVEMDRTAFEDAFKNIHKKRISYQVIRGKDPIKRLLIMSKTEHSGLLAVLHHHHSFFGRLLTHSDTQELLKDQKIPVLIFPAKE